MRIAALIAAKDLRLRLRDRSALLIAVVAPLGLALIFSQLLGGVTDFHARYVVADLDGGRLAQVLRTDVIGPLVQAGVAEVQGVGTEADARGVVDGTAPGAAYDGKPVSAAFVIPAGFTAAIEAGRPTTITIYGARSSGLGPEIARSLVERFGDGVVTVQLSVATAATLRGGPPAAADQARIVQAASTAIPPVRLVDVEASLRQLSLPTYFSASMAILFLFFSAQIGMVSLFEERRQGTLARILAGPVRPWTVLMGKVLGGFAMGVIAMAILVVATTVTIHAEWGPPVGVAALVLAAVISGLGISTLVTSFMRTAEAAGAASSAVAITLGILGGTFSPTSQAPELLATLSLATPHGWFLRGLGDLHGAGATVVDCIPAVAVLLAMGLVTGALGMLRARRLVGAR